MTKALGRLEKVELRDIWESEATEFTPWLAREENLALLGETVGLSLELEAQEKNVGPFRADILCKDISTNSWVLIENQLEKTDHTHLGQILTYAAGLKAVTIIWIASRFTEEHRATLDWLNEITEERFSFLGLEVELWKIGESPVAPKFNIVSKPNDWTREITGAASRIDSGDISDTRKLQQEFWTELKKYMDQHPGPAKATKPLPQQWMNFSIGRSGFKLLAYVNTLDDIVGATFRIETENAKEHYRQLELQREKVDREFGEPLEWDINPEKKSSYVALLLEDAKLSDRGRWPEYCRWLSEKLNKLHTVFAKRVRDLDESLVEE